MNIVQQYPVPKQARSRLPLSCLSLPAFRSTRCRSIATLEASLTTRTWNIVNDRGTLRIACALFVVSANARHQLRSSRTASRGRGLMHQPEGFVEFVCVQTNVDAGVSAGRINQQGLFCE